MDQERHRHECEARYVVSLPTLERRRGYLALVQQARGQAAADALKATVSDLWGVEAATNRPAEP